MIQLSRRSLLLGGIATSVLTATGIAGVSVARADPAEILVRSVIRDRFQDVRMTEEDLSRFAGDYVAQTTSPIDRWLLRLAGSVPDFSLSDDLRAQLPDRLRNKLVALEDGVMNMFLLSTDFFLRNPEDGPVVSYVAFADPLSNPCMNPLARFDA
jgi:hypothetical protein